jgi:Caspase domain
MRRVNPFVAGFRIIIAFVILSCLFAQSYAVAVEDSSARLVAQAVRKADSKYLQVKDLQNFDNTPAVTTDLKDTVPTKRAVAQGRVKAVLSYLGTKNKSGHNVPVATIFLDDREVAERVSDHYGAASDAASVQIAELDPANPYPEVVVSFHTGGPHCCSDTNVITSNAAGTKWRVVHVGEFDGDLLKADDIDGDGRYEFEVRDGAFLDIFDGGYAGSVPPLKILQLDGTMISDVTTAPRYRPAHEAWMRAIVSFDPISVNSFLAGYVAQKILLGEGEEAWKLMLAHYDRTSVEGLEECDSPRDTEFKCPGTMVRRTFPDALAALLEREGYIRANSGTSFGLNQDPNFAWTTNLQIPSGAAHVENEIVQQKGPDTAATSTALPSQDQLGQRVALVVGNSAYRTVSSLHNPRNDAHVVAEELRRLGFVQVTERYDLTLSQLSLELKAFGDRAADSAWAVIYYAGHGIEVGGVNYIIPVDATIAVAAHVEEEALPLERVLSKVEGASKLRLVILDACRDNPFIRRIASSGGTRSLGRGLARVEPSGGVLVVYSARDGQVAFDGDEANSPFAQALVQHLQEPGLEISLLFRKVRDTVWNKTHGEQEPFTYGSLPAEALYFKTAQ